MPSGIRLQRQRHGAGIEMDGLLVAMPCVGLATMKAMSHARRIVTKAAPIRWYRGADVPMRVIREFARRVRERFQPDKIILFGSYAYGVPHADSDVDLLVVMPARNQLSKAAQIDLACDPPFP